MPNDSVTLQLRGAVRQMLDVPKSVVGHASFAGRSCMRDAYSVPGDGFSFAKIKLDLAIQRLPQTRHCILFLEMSGLFEAPRSAGTLFLGGTKTSGQDIRDQNVQATQRVASVICSSFGPSGLDKMMVRIALVP